MPSFKERGTLRRDSGAPSPPRLSVGTAGGAGARCALPAAHGGFPALHLMHSGWLAQPLARSRTRSKCARSCQPADPTGMHRSAPLQPARLLPATLPACLTRARRQLVREAGDPAGDFPGIVILGGRWRTQRSLLIWPPTTRLQAFVHPFLPWGGCAAGPA